MLTKIGMRTGLLFLGLVVMLSPKVMGMEGDWDTPSKEERQIKLTEKLIKASGSGKFKKVEKLLANQVVIDNDVVNKQDTWLNYPLLAASNKGHHEIVKALLDKGARQDIRGPGGSGTPLHAAARGGYMEVVTALLDNDPNVINVPDTLKRTALYSAIDNKKIDIAQELLKREASPDAIGGYAPIIAASEKGLLEITKELLNKRAKIDVKDTGGRTALYWASVRRHRDIVRELLERGANPDLQDEAEDTPLHGVTRYGAPFSYSQDLEIVKELLDKHANPNIQNYAGETPLHNAARRSHSGIVEALLDHDGDKTIKNKKGETPLDLANKAEDKFNVLDFFGEKRKVIEALTSSSTSIALQKKLDLLKQKLSVLKTSLVKLQTQLKELKKAF